MYSFSFRAVGIDAVMAEAERRLDAEIAAQPEHALDRDLALQNLRAHLNMVSSNITETTEIIVNMNGNVTGDYADGNVVNVSTIGTGCSIGLLQRPPAPTPPPVAVEQPVAPPPAP